MSEEMQEIPSNLLLLKEKLEMNFDNKSGAPLGEMCVIDVATLKKLVDFAIINRMDDIKCVNDLTQKVTFKRRDDD